MDINFKVQGTQGSMEKLDKNLRATMRVSELINTATWLQKALIRNGETKEINDWLSYVENDYNILRDVINEE